MKLLSDDDFQALCLERGIAADDIWNNAGMAISLGLPVRWGTREEIARICVDPFGRSRKEGDTADYYADTHQK